MSVLVDTVESLLVTTTPTSAAKLKTFDSKSVNLIGRVLKQIDGRKETMQIKTGNRGDNGCDRE